MTEGQEIGDHCFTAYSIVSKKTAKKMRHLATSATFAIKES